MRPSPVILSMIGLIALAGCSGQPSSTATRTVNAGWLGFVGEANPRRPDGLPGTWSRIAYDLVTGEGDSGQPGLPPEVVGCLAGT